MADAHRENRRLWNEWSDAFQALWNADTDEGGAPPVPTPFDPDGHAATGAEFPPSIKDAAFSEAAFQLVSDLDAAVREARRVLRPGGAFYLAVTARSEVLPVRF
ncbi:methyltransferase domain-containing protein [Halorubrum xinjiangense]|uniref:methyltransferase domain-containing protein n=1 Tax=Halorubrum xinjiangense TaxID=261291 RepID=UPI003C6F2B53